MAGYRIRATLFRDSATHSMRAMGEQGLTIADIDSADTDVLPLSTDYPPGHVLERHRHRRAQLLYGATGVMVLDTDDGSWTVPTDQAVMIPAGTIHRVRMLDVRTLSLYIEPRAVPWWPRRCTVIEVSPLLRELLHAAGEFPIDYDRDARPGAVIRLILLELAAAGPLPLTVSLPPEGPLRECCLDYLETPSVHVTNADWASRAAISERTLDRVFRSLTGSSPAAWRTHARLLSALPRLKTESITEIAAGLGYASPAAFTAAFTRTLGRPPSAYR